VPDAAALSKARDGERGLLAAYDVKIAHASAHEQPQLRAARAIHASHLSALSGKPAHVGTAGHRVHDLPHALAASASELRSLALAALVGQNAALLASIAASHQASADD